ncbi:hypothetical protein [Chryseobacterium sp. ISL-6]|uniref:hypothetical protein n=1 Tax=Chryseobacterium sp. ISL-6 TaxID=2819143 RepID=UPI001BEBBDB5|nr:hypothetical protein [Chryseobacterium sp. ISL-6]MBT2621887.1 hypothetical protein [Chryseobacterium sp. ISL-6]
MNKENRKLPTINLAGAEFYVDATCGLLTDTLNGANSIHIYEMLMLDSHFEMVFDKHTRNLKESDWTNIEDERYAYLWLRPLGVYDPDGAKEKLTEEDLHFLKNLPVIDIEGVNFLWEKQTGHLFQQENPWNMIAKNDAVQSEGVTGFYFDTNKKVVPFPHELPSAKGMLPAHISFIPVSKINQKILLAGQQKTNQAVSRNKGKR